MHRKIIFFILILLVSEFSYSQPEREIIVKLEDALRKSVQMNPQVKLAEINKNLSELNLVKARRSRVFPVMKLSVKTGLVPEARGDVFSSPDKQTDLNNLGPFYRFDFSFAQPVYTFGRIKNSIKAASHLYDSEVLKSRGAEEGVKYQVIKSYLYLNAGIKAVKTAKELRKNFNKLRKEVKDLAADEDSGLDDSSRLEVESNIYRIDEVFFAAEENYLKAKLLFNIINDLPEEQRVVTEKLMSPEFNEKDFKFESFFKKRESSHYVLKAFRTGSLAINSGIKLALSERWPLVYIGGGFQYGHASNRTDIKNPFVYDPFNFTNVTAFLGIDWKISSLYQDVNVKKLRLKEEALNHNQVLYRKKIRIDVKNAFYTCKKNYILLKSVRKSLKSSKTWLALAMDNWEMGIGEVEPLIKAYNMYYKLKAAEIQKNTEFYLSLADFAYKSGKINLFMEWINDGKVKIF